MIRLNKISLVLSFVLLTYSAVLASDYSGEVMSLKGSAQVIHQDASKADLKEGDLLKAGDRIEVGPASHVDVAYDKEWNNLTRLSENSVTTVKAIYPTGLKLDRGDIYAKLGKLPRGTTFEIQTPTAVAAARGTEFLVSVEEGGATEVIGVENRVEVFNVDASGNLGGHVVLEAAQKTEVSEPNQPPSPPEKMGDADFQRVTTLGGEVELSAQEVMDEGREGHTQSIGSVEAMNVLTDFYVPDSERSGSKSVLPTGSETTTLSHEQMTALREQFTEMGGDPAEFDKFKDEFQYVSPSSFDQMHDTFESGNYSPENLPPPDTTAGDGAYDTTSTGAGNYETNTTGGTDAGGGTMMPPAGDPTSGGSYGPPLNDFVPPDTQNIEQTINQTQQQIEQQTEQSTTNYPPPPPPDDPCLTDPAHFTAGGSAGG